VFATPIASCRKPMTSFPRALLRNDASHSWDFCQTSNSPSDRRPPWSRRSRTLIRWRGPVVAGSSVAAWSDPREATFVCWTNQLLEMNATPASRPACEPLVRELSCARHMGHFRMRIFRNWSLPLIHRCGLGSDSLTAAVWPLQMRCVDDGRQDEKRIARESRESLPGQRS